MGQIGDECWARNPGASLEPSLTPDELTYLLRLLGSPMKDNPKLGEGLSGHGALKLREKLEALR